MVLQRRHTPQLVITHTHHSSQVFAPETYSPAMAERKTQQVESAARHRPQNPSSLLLTGHITPPPSSSPATEHRLPPPHRPQNTSSLLLTASSTSTQFDRKHASKLAQHQSAWSETSGFQPVQHELRLHDPYLNCRHTGTEGRPKDKDIRCSSRRKTIPSIRAARSVLMPDVGVIRKVAVSKARAHCRQCVPVVTWRTVSCTHQATSGPHWVNAQLDCASPVLDCVRLYRQEAGVPVCEAERWRDR